MKMSKYMMCVAALAAAAGLASPASAEQRSVTVPAFTQVHAGGSFDVTIEAGKEQSVTLIGATADLDQLELEVERGALKIGPKSRWFGSSSMGKVQVVIQVPRLTAYKLAGSGDAKLTGIDSAKMELAIAGSGEIDAAGKCNGLTVKIAGSGDIDAKALHCMTAAVSIAGSGDIELMAHKSLSARIAGSGGVKVYGNPKERQVKVAGSGEITYVP
jgi:hypothetical protein